MTAHAVSDNGARMLEKARTPLRALDQQPIDIDDSHQYWRGVGCCRSSAHGLRMITRDGGRRISARQPQSSLRAVKPWYGAHIFESQITPPSASGFMPVGFNAEISMARGGRNDGCFFAAEDVFGALFKRRRAEHFAGVRRRRRGRLPP